MSQRQDVYNEIDLIFVVRNRHWIVINRSKVA